MEKSKSYTDIIALVVLAGVAMLAHTGEGLLPFLVEVIAGALAIILALMLVFGKDQGHKTKVIIGLAVFGVMLLLYPKFNHRVDKSPEQTQQDKIKVDSIVREHLDFYKDVRRRIDTFDIENHYGWSTKGMLDAADELEKLGRLVSKIKTDTVYRSKYASQEKAWRTDLIKLQIKNFPMLRKNWVELGESGMEQQDIKVSVSGPNNTVVSFVGYIFYSPEAAQTAVDAINSGLNSLRFKKARYKAPGEDYTTYTIDTPKDSEL